MAVLQVVDEDSLADVLLHLPATPRIVVYNGDERNEYWFVDLRRAREFLIWAFRRFVKGNGGRILVLDDLS